MTRRSFLLKSAIATAGLAVIPVETITQAVAAPAPAATVGWGSTRIFFKLVDGRYYRKVVGREKWIKLSRKETIKTIKRLAEYRRDLAFGKFKQWKKITPL